MNLTKQAEIILEELDKYISIDWNFKEAYIKGIIEGLKRIQE